YPGRHDGALIRTLRALHPSPHYCAGLVLASESLRLRLSRWAPAWRADRLQLDDVIPTPSGKPGRGRAPTRPAHLHTQPRPQNDTPVGQRHVQKDFQEAHVRMLRRRPGLQPEVAPAADGASPID